MINFSFQTTTGIYVGAKHVYIAQLKSDWLGPRLIKFAKTAIPAPSAQAAAGPPQATETTQPAVEAIQKLLRESGISAKRVLTALAGKDVLIRYFQMPRIPKTEWETAIKFEAKKYIPFKIEELMWDFHAVLLKDKKTMMDVTFVAVKKLLAQKHLSLLEQAGLKPKILEPAPFSLVRLLDQGHQLVKNSPTAIVDVNYGGADINIVKDKVCYLTRDITLPSDPSVIFDNLLNEIRMTLDYYAKLFPAENITKILLCGEVDLKDWDKILAEELKVPVEKINLLRAVKVKKVLPPLSMAVAIGLGLRGQAQVAADVNLYRQREAVAPTAALPKKKEVFEFTAQMRRAAMWALAISCICILALFITSFQRVRQETKRLQQVVALRPQTKLPIGSLPYTQIESARQELAGKLSAIKLIIEKRIFWTDKLNELPKVIPQGVWLTDLSIAEEMVSQNRVNRTLELQGTAYHEDPVEEIAIVTQFVNSLKENKEFARGFKQIKLEKVAAAQLNAKPVKNFTISCF